MRCALRLFALVSILLVISAALVSAQQILYDPDFSPTLLSPTRPLSYNGQSRISTWQSQTVLRLTDGSSSAETSSAYFKIPQPVDQGFSTYFKFQIHTPTICCDPGDGFAFIVQGSNATNSLMGASGFGLSALGAGGGGMGYAGINDSLAVEFDIYGDPWDPNSNHIAIQTCGGDYSMFNTPVHLPGTYTIGQDNDVTSCLLSSAAINTSIPMLGGTCNDSGCTDGAVHQAVVEYDPPANGQPGQLQVWLDPVFLPGTHTPAPNSPSAISVPYDIVYSSSNPDGLQLYKHSLFAGFTGGQPQQSDGQPSGGTTTDIIAWEFTPHGPTQITQQIPNGPTEADYAFGGHQLGVTYPTGFVNCNPTCINMTVVGTPVNQQTFYNQRLLGTNFADENCIIYLQTGGNCVVYSVTCQDPNGNQVTCPTEPIDPGISICTQFTTSEPVSNVQTDFLEADPIGSNNWCSIWTGFSDNDPIVSGKGTGFSDIVATLSPTGQGQHCGGASLKKIVEKLEQQQKRQKHPPQGGPFCPNS
jgi:hypothetical protein